jgi:hypothetical protein
MCLYPRRMDNSAMKLTDDEISAIASWKPIDDEFSSIAKSAIASILYRIEASKTYTLRVFEDGGLSNYVAFLVCRTEELSHEPRETYRKLQPLAVNLSLCAPVGVIGRIHAYYGTEFCCIKYLNIDNLLDPSALTNDLERFVANVIAESPFTLMHPDDVRLPLPSGVVPYGYCLTPEPWNKHFHALFANTD